MKKILLIILVLVIAVLLGYTGTTMVLKNTDNQSALIYNYKDSTDTEPTKPVLCLVDTNKDTIINVADEKEFYVTSVDKCLKVKGAPGYTYTKVIEPEPVVYIQKILGFFQATKTMAAIGSEKVTFASTSSSSVSQTVGVVKGILTRADLRGIQRDRARSGVDKKAYEPDIYVCVHFARDLELSDPDKYTITNIDCAQLYSCIDKKGKKQYIWSAFRHEINDVHLVDGGTGYTEPQDGTEVKLDGNNDGKVDDEDRIQVANSENMLDKLTEKSKDVKKLKCKKGTFKKEDGFDDSLSQGKDNKFKNGLRCIVKSYESSVEAYEKDPDSYIPGFNPN